MKNRTMLRSILALALSSAIAQAATPLGTAFTYQGKLTDGGNPANGSYDLKFTLFDDASGGNAVSGPITNSPVSVTNGLFTTTLDFGAAAWDGSARWLQIAVRTNGSPSDFTVLEPRQPLTPTPYGTYASKAGNAVVARTVTEPIPDRLLSMNVALLNTNASFVGMVSAGRFAGNGSLLTGINSLDSPGGGPTNALIVGVTGWVGIGTNNPQAGLHVTTGQSSLLPALQAEVVDGVGGFNRLAGARSVFVAGANAFVVAYNDNALTILDVSNPRSPQLQAEVVNGVGGFNWLVGAWSVFVAGTNAYVASETGGSLTIIDVSNPRSPQLQSQVVDEVHSPGSPYHYLWGARSVFVSGTNAYVASSGGALTIIDVSNPRNPRLQAELHDVRLGDAASVFVSQNTAYVAAWSGNCLAVIDVANPRNPQVLTWVLDGQGGFNRLQGANCVFVAGTNAYVTAEHSLTIIDVSNPLSPRLQAEVVNGQGGFSNLWNASGVFVSGTTAYVTATSGALTLIDVSDPGNPHWLAEVADGQGGFNRLAGATGVYVVGSTVFVAAYGDNALTILNTRSPAVGLAVDNWVGIGTTQPRSALEVVGTVTATAFAGDSAGMTNLSASNLASGTVADARLSANVALRNANQTFSGANTFSNAGNSFTGSGSGLTGLNASSLGSGTVADGRLSANVALRSGNQTFTGANTFNNAGSSFTGNGSGLVNVDADLFASRLPGSAANQVPINNGVLCSTLNADLLDGQHGSYFQNAANLNTGTLPSARLGADSIDSVKLVTDPASLAKVSGNAMTSSGGNINASGNLSAGQALYSSLQSKMQISPLHAVRVQTTVTLELITDDYGGIRVTTSAAGTYQVVVPIDLPLQMYGRKPTSWTVTTYYAGANLNNYITRTRVHCSGASVGDNTYTEDTTDRTSYTATSYTITGPANFNDEGRSKCVEYQIVLQAGGMVRIGSVVVTYTY